jgi:hypothetical protein
MLSYHPLFQDKDVLTAARTRVWQAAGLAAGFLVFSSPGIWTRWHGSQASYVPATIGLVLLLVAIVVFWDRTGPENTDAASPWWRPAPLLTAAAGCALVVAGALHWVGLVIAHPIDPTHADMLPVIDAALGRFLHGRDPYSIYHVPWEAPLGYGPVLWAPFLVPHLLHADMRLVTLFGELAVPGGCALAAIAEAKRGRSLAAVSWLVLIAAIVFNPDLATFTTVGHTPAFWPLLPLFALLITGGQWGTAGFVLGLIAVGRTTMVAAVPVFFMAVWTRDRASLWRALLLWLTPVIVLMVPFAIWDPHALWYGMVAVYPRVIKETVWSSPGGAIFHTIGITGWLVVSHLERFVELTQVVVVCVVWFFAWLAVRRGASPLPWMALAVLGFCMTTLWPLYYIYFDVLMLFVSATIAETLGAKPIRWTLVAWTASLAATAALVLVTLRATTQPNPRLDFQTRPSRRLLYNGFTVSKADGEPPIAWIWGNEGIVSLPRSSNSAAAIVVTADPVIPRDGPPQLVTAFLNGRPLGSVQALRGWQPLRFHAAHIAWLIGANQLKLVCLSTARPAMIGMSDDARQLSLAVRQIDVVPDDDRHTNR